MMMRHDHRQREHTAMLTLGKFFQFGYVTNDFEAAIERFSNRFDISQFKRFDTADVNPKFEYHSLIALAWVGDIMVELIQPKDPLTPLYVDALPKSGFGVNLHHLGYLIEEETAWHALQSELSRKGFGIASKSSSPGKIDGLHADARPFCGHYLEYLWARGDGLTFLRGAPQNRSVEGRSG
jgi:hypothetical protein